MVKNLFKYAFLNIMVLVSNNGYTQVNNPNAGLVNIGATCYMNATIQSLANIPDFVNDLNNAAKSLYKNKDTNAQLIHELARVMKLLNDNPNGSYEPYDFKDLLGESNKLFEGVAANDSKDLINHLIMTGHEMLNQNNNNNDTTGNLLLDQRNYYQVVNNFINDFNTKNYSVFSKEFYATNWDITQCSNCKTLSYNAQTYFFLIFPLEEVRKYRDLAMYNGLCPFSPYCNTNIITLSDCFTYESKINTMIGQNNMYCNYCRYTCPSSMHTQLINTPETLIIILNRGKGIEFNVNLQVEQFIDLQNFVVDLAASKKAKYYLSGVITHIGESGMGGHFISYNRKSPNEKWYKYNDALVSPASDDKGLMDKELLGVLNGNTYMSYVLFYKRLDDEQQSCYINPLQKSIKEPIAHLPLLIPELSITMNASDILQYIQYNRNTSNCTMPWNNSNDLIKTTNALYNTIINKTGKSKKKYIDQLLQTTILFIHNWSTNMNPGICQLFANTWANVLKHLQSISGTDPYYKWLYQGVKYLTLDIDSICKMNVLQNYNIDVRKYI